MSAASDKVRILLIQPWTQPLAPIRAALRDAGIDARIFRIDIEVALNAALERNGYDLAVFDPTTPAITRENLEACMREHQRYMPIVTFDGTDTLVANVRVALAQRLN
ncbi:MAG TPA: hypothetical protein VIV11_36815 [Kofleriaceae bacterium]